MKIYWASVEYIYNTDHPDYSTFKGGFVYTFMIATDVRDALDKLLNELDMQNLNPIEIEYLSPYKDISWESEEENKKYEALAKEAKRTGNVVFDDFYAYENKGI